jgi:S1-C subfamily serine protease
MSVESPPEPERAPILRREALLPSERSRGLGTIAVVCTMAGVASGLALATTLMAMQVADSMSVRTCPYHASLQTQQVELQPEHGFLGIRYVFRDGYAEIDSILPDTPAQTIELHRGDRVLAVDGAEIHSVNDLQSRIYNSHPGAQPNVLIERDGKQLTVHPTLVAWPAISY